MSPAVIALIVLLAIAVVVAVVLVVRMNREPEVTRVDRDMLPLFTSQGVMTEGYRPDDGAEPNEAADADRAAVQRDVARREALQREASKREAAQREAAQRETAQRETAQREATQREAAQREAPPREAPLPEAAAASISPAELERMKAAASAAPNGAPRTPPAPSAPRPLTKPVVRTFTTGTPLREAPPAAAPVAEGVAVPPPSTPVRATSSESMVHFNIPNDGTLQFLPGRLEVTSGQDAGREIRFVRLPSLNGDEFTFGRSDGEVYRHIQLRDQTVSRAHAKMRFAGGRWFLQNLSHTNPVVHDGRPLATGEELLLEDGARIEMGEVLFAFKTR